jgi:tRNA pseudouridine38-40 synthase
MKRFTYRVQIAYDGTAFAAFAPVPGERTVWSALRAALIAVAPGFGHLASGGRTDRGASATGQVISFISRDLVELDRIAQAIDEAVPGALAALDMRRVPDKFHAQFSACFRRYVYFHPDDGTYDARRIDAMLGALVGRRDFRAFARDTPLGKKTEKTLYEASAGRVPSSGSTRFRSRRARSSSSKPRCSGSTSTAPRSLSTRPRRSGSAARRARRAVLVTFDDGCV